LEEQSYSPVPWSGHEAGMEHEDSCDKDASLSIQGQELACKGSQKPVEEDQKPLQPSRLRAQIQIQKLPFLASRSVHKSNEKSRVGVRDRDTQSTC
jgi:hypothetical protein